MKVSQKDYQFTLVLKNVNENTLDLEDALYESGCDDALVNCRNGTVYLDFDRKANSLNDAVLSAISDVESSTIKPVVLSQMIGRRYRRNEVPILRRMNQINTNRSKNE